MYVCMCVYICKCVYVSMCMCTCIYVYMYAYIYMCVYIYSIYIYVYIYMCVCILYIYIHIYILYIYIYIYIYIYTLRLNIICSENSSYDKYCNELEERYCDKARTHKRQHFLKNVKDKRNDYQLVLNITYHPNFSTLKDTILFLHHLPTHDQEHQKVFHKVPITDFRRA